MGTPIFVYGTLKQGCCRNFVLAGQVYGGQATTEARYRLLDCGDYPGLVEAVAGQSIQGELWRVSEACLARLDEVEDVAGGLYERRFLMLEPPWDQLRAQAYFYLGDATRLPDLGRLWRPPVNG